jgi:2'-5' RNA ligase
MSQPNYLDKQKNLVKELENSFRTKNYSSTVVDMQSDYENDDQICLTSVVLLPDRITSAIVQKISKVLKDIDPTQYFYQPASMHLTIKNIRTINNPPLFNDSDIKRVKSVFHNTVSKFSTFDFAVEDLILFPTSISVMAYASDELQKLVLALDRALNEAGVPDNKKYISDSVFWGNITICRFTKEPSQELIKAAQGMRDIKIDGFRVEQVDLITCNAVCNPATRRILSSYNLKTS